MSHRGLTTAVPLPDPSLEDLYRDHRRWLQAWLHRKLGSTADAADLAHDTFVRLLARPQVEAIREPRAYLRTVAHGLMVNHLRRRDIERACLEALAALPLAEAPDPATVQEMIETLVRIDAMLDGLESRVRRAFLLSQLEGWTYPRIAEHLGVSVRTVSNDMFTAIRHCLALRR